MSFVKLKKPTFKDLQASLIIGGIFLIPWYFLFLTQAPPVEILQAYICGSWGCFCSLLGVKAFDNWKNLVFIAVGALSLMFLIKEIFTVLGLA